MTILVRGAKQKVGTRTYLNFWSDWWVGDMPLGATPDIMVPFELEHMRVSHIITEDKTQDCSVLESLLPNNITNHIRSIPIALEESQEDALSWPHSGTGHFTIKYAFNFIAGNLGEEVSHGKYDVQKESNSSFGRSCWTRCLALVNFNATAHTPLLRWIDKNYNRNCTNQADER